MTPVGRMNKHHAADFGIWAMHAALFEEAIHAKQKMVGFIKKIKPKSKTSS